MKPYAFGVDIGGTTVKIGLFSTEGRLLEKWEIKTRTEDNSKNVLPDIVDAIRGKLTEKGLSADQVEGIGIGVPGPVGADGTVFKCVNLGWDVFNLKTQMNAILPEIPNVAAGNDANVAALGELWQGGGKGHDSAVMITLGTGVGGGVVIGGKIIAGFNGGGGEIGHMTVNPHETKPCACGKCGCLEQYASANGIVRLGQAMLAESDKPSKLREMDSFSSKDICDLAREGEEMASDIVNRCGAYLGQAMGYISCTVDPEIYVLGGGMSRAGAVVMDAIIKNYKKFAFHVSRDTPLAVAELGNDAGMYGCVKMIL